MEDVRVDLIEHIRQQIEAGTYVTQRKLEIVCDRIIASLTPPDRTEET